MTILVINAGSSSLKVGLFADDDGLEQLASASGSLDEALAALPHTAITAIGQRVVHGGTRFTDAVRIDAAVKADLAELIALAPLHNPPALAAIAAAEKLFPGIPQVATFDTAFFARLPEEQVVYPVPWQWTSEWGVRRFGFHGPSHAYCAERAAQMLGRDGLRVISCHLGGGCSATASMGGVPVATTMGFSPMDGLMMGTRPGALDPEILLYVQRRGLGLDALDRALNHESGLRGVSGISGDVRDLAKADTPRARLALRMFVVRVKAAIGALATAMGGVDVLVFTAGIGEHSAEVRAQICAGLDFLGVRISEAHPDADADISAASAAVRTLVIHTREELMIARDVRRVLGR